MKTIIATVIATLITSTILLGSAQAASESASDCVAKESLTNAATPVKLTERFFR